MDLVKIKDIQAVGIINLRKVITIIIRPITISKRDIQITTRTVVVSMVSIIKMISIRTSRTKVMQSNLQVTISIAVIIVILVNTKITTSSLTIITTIPTKITPSGPPITNSKSNVSLEFSSMVRTLGKINLHRIIISRLCIGTQMSMENTIIKPMRCTWNLIKITTKGPIFCKMEKIIQQVWQPRLSLLLLLIGSTSKIECNLKNQVLTCRNL
mmetsp:Transcript_4541/g.3047  ORF Transcript_4541/g.3047 Transcript_4541/m.3047 type:complete len:213 (+) Transcript_4541:246-884(+)